MVAATHGVLPAIFASLQAKHAPGGSVGFFSPAYGLFQTQIADAMMVPKPIAIPDKPITYEIATQLLMEIAGGVLILNNPHNPTGRVFARGEVKAICDAAKQFRIP